MIPLEKASLPVRVLLAEAGINLLRILDSIGPGSVRIKLTKLDTGQEFQHVFFNCGMVRAVIGWLDAQGGLGIDQPRLGVAEIRIVLILNLRRFINFRC